MRRFHSLALAMGTLVVTAAASYAAVPLSTLKRWQDGAPEALEVTVMSVKEDKRTVMWSSPTCSQTIYDFTVTARVNLVHRSASGVQPGQTITLHNSLQATGPCVVPDGSFGVVLNWGDHVEAYLRPAGTPDGAFLAVNLQRLSRRHELSLGQNSHG